MARPSREAVVPDRPLTTGEVARYCHTTVMQVNRWINQGQLKAFRNPGGQHRIVKGEFRHFLQRHEMPIVEEFFADEPRRLILVADDDVSLAKAIRHILLAELPSYTVEMANDGYEALLKTGDLKPALLILDIRMPLVDGLEVCRRLRQNAATRSAVRILAITGHSEAFDRKTVLASGADEYLLKPFEHETLMQQVHRLLP